MYAGVYLALFGLAAAATYCFVVREEAVVFTSAIATATWAMLALTGSTIEVATGGEIQVMTIGAAQYLLLGLALLSLIALIGSILGWYPEDRDIRNEDYMPQ